MAKGSGKRKLSDVSLILPFSLSIGESVQRLLEPEIKGKVEVL